jgi:hypothetical protein
MNQSFADTINLNGAWEFGENRAYAKKMIVPGLASEPDQMNEGTLWFRKEINLPAGIWTHATLILKGALFSPAVYINGEKISQRNGENELYSKRYDPVAVQFVLNLINEVVKN